LAKKRILLVDDSKTVLLTESLALRNGPYEIAMASNGEECLASIAAARPDLVLLDMVMPRMGGLETCQRLRRDPATQDIPVIFVTTRGEPENREAGMAAGCNDFVTKPFNSGELLARIRRLVGE
jgi:CheY-like chemotaxis protein